MHPNKNVLCIIHGTGSNGKRLHFNAKTVNINSGNSKLLPQCLCLLMMYIYSRLNGVLLTNQYLLYINTLTLYLRYYKIIK
jgi:hypothetical protein